MRDRSPRQGLAVGVAAIAVAMLLGPGLLGGQPHSVRPEAMAQGSCPPVQNTPFFTIIYGAVTVNGEPASTGVVVEARSPRGDTVGCFVVSDPGDYGAMYVYGEDTSVSPPIPGMRSGETVAFLVAGHEATATPALVWTNDRDLHQVDLAVTDGPVPPSPTPTSTPTPIPIPPPVADFTASPTSGVAPLLVQFTDLSTGQVDEWHWDFGDGETSMAQNPAHTYVTPGTYDVTLTCSGPDGSDSLTAEDIVTVYEPVVADFSASPTSGPAPLTVVFTDQSTGDYTSRLWSFGDGESSTAQNPAHTYVTPGTYDVTLTCSGPGGTDSTTHEGIVTVYEPVVADFSASPTSGPAPLTVVFTDQSTGDYTSRLWSFGDGESSTAQNPTHTYVTPGTYDVTLTCTGPGGTDSITAEDIVTVYEPVVADFSASPTSGPAPLTVVFTDQSTGDYTSRLWSFGDGESSTAQNPTHTYTEPGTYTVALTASGPGGTDTMTRADYITVSEAPLTDFMVYLPAILRGNGEYEEMDATRRRRLPPVLGQVPEP